LLKAGVDVLKGDGVLVYSTCSSEPEDNELIIDWAINNLPVELEPVETIGDPALTRYNNQSLSPQLSKCSRLWPHKTNTQPFFIAKLRKVR
jgi:16S rRNA C967 or C1407 C5-methylase (RsmB/RsmF family)